MLENDEQFEDDDFDDEEFAAVDALIGWLKEAPRNEVFVLNPPRIQQMRFACAMIKRVLSETKSPAQLECKKHEFEQSVGVITVEAPCLNIKDIERFSRAAEFANNVEIYPLKANAVRMSFTFYNILIPIDKAK